MASAALCHACCDVCSCALVLPRAVAGLLTNSPAGLSLERLHALLRLFVVGEPKYEGKSQEQLLDFLTLLEVKGRVASDAVTGVYKRGSAG